MLAPPPPHFMLLFLFCSFVKQGLPDGWEQYWRQTYSTLAAALAGEYWTGKPVWVSGRQRAVSPRRSADRMTSGDPERLGLHNRGASLAEAAPAPPPHSSLGSWAPLPSRWPLPYAD